jgi:hypothetical protein
MRAIVTHHCSVCHTDVVEGARHSCGGTPTDCGPPCYAGSARVLTTEEQKAMQAALRASVKIVGKGRPVQ